MKNLKDYFSSPKSSDEQTVNIDVSLSSDQESASKKKRKVSDKKKTALKTKKRKKSEEIEAQDSGVSDVSKTDSQEENVVKKKSLKVKKRKLEGDKVTDVRVSTPAESEKSVSSGDIAESVSESGSSQRVKKRKKKESIPEDCEEVGAEPSPASDRANLLKYFNKVDKTYLTREDKTLVKVEALVHTPPASKKKPDPASRPKRKVKKRRDISAEFDLITSEEESVSNGSPELGQTPTPAPWKMRIALGTPNKVSDELPEEVENVEQSGNSKSKLSKHPEVSNSSDGAKDNLTSSESEIPLSEDYSNSSSSSSESNSKTSATEVSSSNKLNDGVSADDSPVLIPDSPVNVIPLAENNVKTLNDDAGTADKSAIIVLSDSPEKDTPPAEKTGKPSNGHTSCPADVSAKNITPSRLQEKKLKGGTLASYFGLKVTPPDGSKSSKGKTSLTKEQIKAKQQFLESGVPDSVKKIIQQTKSDEVEGEPAPFPLFSHTRQKDKFSMMWNLPDANLKGTLLPGDPPRVPPWSQGLISDDIETTREVSGDIRKVTLKDLKEKEKALPIKAWHKGLTSMKKSSNPSEMWTERYRPKTCSEVLLNGSTVDKLASWLQAHAVSNNEGKDGESSSDEFVSQDGDGPRRSRYTALLVGPPGTGKTAAVYAAAKHNGYQVLELNASCNRNGKKILNEFSEATQSHKVETKALFKTKSKKKKVEPNNKSLILIEDADLVFNDIDEGFVSCLSSLQTGSKRPLVLTVNDPKVKHISKLAPANSAFVLHFERPPLPILCAYLRTLALVEGHSLSEDSSKKFVKNSSNDLRKSLTTLQLYLPKDPEESRDNSVVSCLSNDVSSSEKIMHSAKIGRILSDLDIIRRSACQNSLEFCEMRESTVLDPSTDPPNDPMTQDLEDIIFRNISSQLTTDVITYKKGEINNSDVSSCLPLVNQLSRNSVAMDYLPIVRSIARSEKVRLATHTKRNNRFFNYLNNSGLPTDPDLLDSLCESFVQ